MMLYITMNLIFLSRILYLLCVLPSVLAFPTGAPPRSCGDMMPRHGDAKPAPANKGFYLLGEVFNGTYIPGKAYQIQLMGTSTEFKGFFIQARAEKDQESVSSIVGTWNPLNTEARTQKCNNVEKDSITHSSNDLKKKITFNWTAPSTDVGRIHFLYTIVISYSNFIVKLNATKERPSPNTTYPPNEPSDAPCIGFYGQPSGCQQEQCEFYLEWRRNGEFIDFIMEGNGTGWIALGITVDNSILTTVNRSFVDVLACQANATRSVVNFKDLYLPGNGSTTLLFDSSTEGVFYTSGRLESGRIFCNFTRVGYALPGQENEDANFNEDNYIFFMSGTATGAADEVPVVIPADPAFSSSTINLNRGFIAFTDSFTSLPGKGSYPSSSCSREDCNFYFRWGVNPNNPNYLTFFISADLSRGWAAVGVSDDRRMGGDKIDDIFGCVTTDNGSQLMVADTYNVAGGERNNIGDISETVGIIPHKTEVIDGRIQCTFSRIISVVIGEETCDFNLNNSYYIIIGKGEKQDAPFPRHEHNPKWSTSKVNLVQDTSVDFDYARVPLIKTHGILMILAWPVLAYLGITMARHMKPALANGGWFQIHRFLMLTSLLFTCLGFVSIFIAFRNNYTRGLIDLGDVNVTGTVHFIIGFLVLLLQFANPIIALCRCKPTSEKRWIFNTFHAYAIGFTLQLLGLANVLIGLYLFEDKIANPQDMNAYWIMVALMSAIVIVDVTMCTYFGFSHYYCVERTQPGKAYLQIGSSDDNKVSKRTPSPDRWLRWAGWITQAVIAVSLGIVISVIYIVGIGWSF